MGELAHTLSHGAKILQSESSSAELLEQDGQFALFVSSGFEHLQVLERCNAPCLQEALSRQSVATAFSKQFAAKTRIATTDEASANYACERSITASPERHGWESTHYPCEVHMCARIHSSVFSLMQSDVAGLIRHALSLNVSAQMNAFRRALREEIRSRGIRVIRGAPPPDATRHRRRVLRLFCSHGRCSIQRQALLVLLPNGDWRKSELQMYVLGADAVDKDAALSVFTNGLITAFAGTVFEVYPRHRWTSADLAIDRCGLLESVHGLGSATYARYMRLLAVVAHEPATGASAESEVLPLSYASAAYDGGAEDRGYGEEGATAAEGGGAGNSTQRMGDAAAFNAQSRRVASAWWATKPLVSLVVMRLLIEPLKQLLAEKLGVNGAEWDLQQMRTTAKEALARRPYQRAYKLTEATNNTSELACLWRGEMLLKSDELWQVLPARALTQRTSCLAFRMLSRIGCAVQELLIARHEQLPTKLFLLLTRPD